MTKAEVKAAYFANLRDMYAGRVDYSDGSRAFAAATKAVDAALEGTLKLEGEAWFSAIALAGLKKTATKAQIAALPA